MTSLAILLAAFMCAQSASADSSKVRYHVQREESASHGVFKIALPYAFSTESLGLNFGVAAGVLGAHQKGMGFGGTVFGSGEDKSLYAALANYRLEGTRRWFFSAQAMASDFPNQRLYGGAAIVPVPAGVPLPGSNNSSNEQQILGTRNSNWFDLRLEYMLPFGDTSTRAMVEYRTRKGLLISQPTGGPAWNPLRYGSSALSVRYFGHKRSAITNIGEIDGDLLGLELGLIHDNTDFIPNPSRGSRQYLAFTVGNADPNSDWKFWQFETSKFISFGPSRHTSQRTLALNLWTGLTSSWKVETQADGSRLVRDGAPYNEGARLGGYRRLRGFDLNRFHDKTALYLGAEYRATMRYNPLASVSWLQWLQLDWFQLVGFAEAGRVAPRYRVDELVDDMQTDVGISLRALLGGLVVRADLGFARSSSGNLWLFINQPF